MASICNDEQGCVGVMSGHEQETAKLNGHDPYAYPKDALERLPTQRAGRIGELLPHRWTPAAI